MEFIAHDTARVWKSEAGARTLDELMAVLYFGDGVEVVERKPNTTKVRLGPGREGWVRGELKTTAAGPLALAFIDVGQGDACLMTTPSGHRVLVDGGENKLAARYLASRYWDETVAGKDVNFDAIVITHGDADHFDGLSTLVLDAAAETRDRKRIRVTASRVLHNGLVKRGSSLSERDHLGAAVEANGTLFAPVIDDPRAAKDANRPFQRWSKALDELARRGPTTISRLDDQTPRVFDFLGDVKISVLGPTVHRLKDGTVGLPLLAEEGSSSISSAQTINGHSIVLRITYGNVTTLLTGDLNAGSEADLLKRGVNVRADVLKVPHHGSDDVSRPFIDAIRPLISIISAGDEDARRDYLHPRANLLAMLGQARRGAEPVVFVTNLAAFDRWAGEAFYAVKDNGVWKPDVARGTFYARERTAYGIIHVRTDGKRLFVARAGARKDRYEAYGYVVHPDGKAESRRLETI